MEIWQLLHEDSVASPAPVISAQNRLWPLDWLGTSCSNCSLMFNPGTVLLSKLLQQMPKIISPLTLLEMFSILSLSQIRNVLRDFKTQENYLDSILSLTKYHKNLWPLQLLLESPFVNFELLEQKALSFIYRKRTYFFSNWKFKLFDHRKENISLLKKKTILQTWSGICMCRCTLAEALFLGNSNNGKQRACKTLKPKLGFY